MPVTTKIAGLLCGMLIFAVAGDASTAAHKARTAPKPATPPAPAVQPQPVVAPVTQAPVTPPMPSELPAVPPKVTLNNGQLSIVAENSNLGDVLSAVKNLTGAGLEVPSSANSERIVVRLGPGPSQQVLQQLFNGSKFDYIILGANDATGAVSKIILTPRNGSGATGTAVAARNTPNQPPVRAGYQPPTEPDADQDAGQVEEEIAQPEPPPPQNEEVTPPVPGAQQGIVGPGGQAANPDQQPKTPEQLLQELQRQQQQQQQQGQPGQRPERGQVPPNSQ